MNREKITFTGARETLLATLYGRAIDSRSPRSILRDQHAEQVCERIDYDFRRTGVGATAAAGIALRARQLDDWTAEFLVGHPQATVLHLACGLDARIHRLGPLPAVRWLDVDFPEVIELRQRLLPAPGGDYRMIASSVTERGWLDEVPADRPTVVVFEGLSMYLSEEDGKRLIQGVTGRFPSGQLLFDCYGTVGIRLQKLVPAIRNAKARLQWAIDDPRAIEGWHDGLECLDALRIVDMPRLEKLPPSGRLGMWAMARIPGFRDIGRILRYRF